MRTSPTRSICILHWLLQHLSYWRAPTRDDGRRFFIV